MTDTVHPYNTLDQESPLPLFMQIRMQLLPEILNWPDPAQKFYGDEALASRFGVSRMTVRQAIAGIVDDGLLRRRSGLGTFVAERVFVERLDRDLNIAEQYAKIGIDQQVRAVTWDYRDATPEEAAELDLDSDAEVLSIVRVRSIASSPLAVDERLICGSIARAAGFEPETADDSIIDRLRATVPVGDVRWSIGAIKGGARLAGLLLLDPEDTVLERRMSYLSVDGLRILTGRTVHRADMVRYGFSISLAEGQLAPTEMVREEAIR